MAFKRWIALVVVLAVAVTIPQFVVVNTKMANWQQHTQKGLVMKIITYWGKIWQHFGSDHYLVYLREYFENRQSATTVDNIQDGIKVYNDYFGDVRVRLYERENRANKSAALIYIHGGGWVVGSPEMEDPIVLEIVKRSDVLVISIDYRLAPEYPYPIPFEDCYNTLEFVMKNHNEHRVNPKRISVTGASAGGNLAAAVALKAKDNGIKLKMQALVVPALQAFDFMTPSYQEHKHLTMALTKYLMIDFWITYATGVKLYDPELDIDITNIFAKNKHTSKDIKRSKYDLYTDHELVDKEYRDFASYQPKNRYVGYDDIWDQVKDVIVDPYFAPLMADDLSGLSEAYILTAQFDVLRDDGMMYAKRLEKAGVKVTLQNFATATHMSIYDEYDTSKECLSKFLSFLENNL